MPVHVWNEVIGAASDPNLLPNTFSNVRELTLDLSTPAHAYDPTLSRNLARAELASLQAVRLVGLPVAGDGGSWIQAVKSALHAGHEVTFEVRSEPEVVAGQWARRSRLGQLGE